MHFTISVPSIWCKDWVADAHPVFKAHLLLGMSIFLVSPFTRLVHVWSAPVWYLGRRGYQIVRTNRTIARATETQAVK